MTDQEDNTTKPAPYPESDSVEQTTIEILERIFSDRIKSFIESRDKVPNHDGHVELVDSENHPIGKIDVQIKRLPPGKQDPPRRQFETQHLAYCRTANTTFVAILVDIDSEVGYWKHITEEWFEAEELDSQTYKTVRFDEQQKIAKYSGYETEWTKLIKSNRQNNAATDIPKQIIDNPEETIDRPPVSYELSPNVEQLNLVDKYPTSSSELIIPGRRRILGNKITVSNSVELQPSELEDLFKTLSRYAVIDMNDGAFSIQHPGACSWQGFGAGTFVETLTADTQNRTIRETHHKEIATWIGSGSKFHENTIIVVTNDLTQEFLPDVQVAFSSYGVPLSQDFRRVSNELPVDFSTTTEFDLTNFELSRSEKLPWRPDALGYSSNYKPDNLVDIIQIPNPFENLESLTTRVPKDQLTPRIERKLKSIMQWDTLMAHLRSNPPYPSEDPSLTLETLLFQDLGGNQIHGDNLVVEARPAYE